MGTVLFPWSCAFGGACANSGARLTRPGVMNSVNNCVHLRLRMTFLFFQTAATNPRFSRSVVCHSPAHNRVRCPREDNFEKFMPQSLLKLVSFLVVAIPLASGSQ